MSVDLEVLQKVPQPNEARFGQAMAIARALLTYMNEIDVVTGRIRQLVSATTRLEGVSVSWDDRLIYADLWHYQFLYVVDVETGLLPRG